MSRTEQSNESQIARWLRWLEVDSPLFSAILARLWQAASGPITVLLVLSFLSTGEQGVYYALVSIAALQGFFELGLLNLLITHIGRQVGGVLVLAKPTTGFWVSPPLTLSPDHEPADIVARLIAMRSITRAAKRWFLFASIAFIAVSLAVGFRGFSDVNVNVDWQLPLIALVLSTACIVVCSPDLATLEGMGLRESIYRMRLIQMMVGTICVWISLAFGAGIWSIVVASAVQAIFSGWMVWTHRSLGQQVFAQAEQLHIGQKSEAPVSDLTARQASPWIQRVMPGQWRIALLSITQILATQVSTLIVLSYHGEKAAAPLGMTLSIISPIQMLAIAWLQTKLGLVAALHGRGDREVAGKLWRRTGLISTALLGLGLMLLAAGIACVTTIKPEWESRFITLPQMIVFSFGLIANHLVATQSFYVMSRFSMPVFLPSLIGLSAVTILVWIGGITHSVDGVIVGYTIGTCGLLLPLHTLGYAKLRKK